MRPQRLARATNELIAEISRLQQLRTGQLAQLEGHARQPAGSRAHCRCQQLYPAREQGAAGRFPGAPNILRQRRRARHLRSVAFLNYVDAVRAGRAQPQHEIRICRRQFHHLESRPPAHPVRRRSTTSAGPWVLFVLHDIDSEGKARKCAQGFCGQRFP